MDVGWTTCNGVLTYSKSISPHIRTLFTARVVDDPAEASVRPFSGSRSTPYFCRGMAKEDEKEEDGGRADEASNLPAGN